MAHTRKTWDGFRLELASFGIQQSWRMCLRNAPRSQNVPRACHVGRESQRGKIGICWQVPSDYPEFAQFLVEQGIDSISLNPDAVLKTTITILEMEPSLDGKI
jgi:hypothetical protein